MRRPIIGKFTNKNNRLDVNVDETKVKLAPQEVERRLRQQRSPSYMSVMTQLDAGGHARHDEQVQRLIQQIQQELPELTLEQLPVGIVAKCYLGDSYEVHCLDRALNIIQHYKRHQSLPPLLERARGLAMHPGYAFIEVYTDCLRVVRANGEVSVV